MGWSACPTKKVNGAATAPMTEAARMGVTTSLRKASRFICRVMAMVTRMTMLRSIPGRDARRDCMPLRRAPMEDGDCIESASSSGILLDAALTNSMSNTIIRMIIREVNDALIVVVDPRIVRVTGSPFAFCSTPI